MTEPENARIVWQGFITQRVMATFVRRIPHAVGIDSFNRMPCGPRAKGPTGGIPTRGALPTRLNECAIFNCPRYCNQMPELQRIGPTRGRIGCVLDFGNANRTAMSL